MSNTNGLQRRLQVLALALEQRQQRNARIGRVIIYDPDTGEPLPGYEVEGGVVWLPKKRDIYEDVRNYERDQANY